MHVLIFEMDHFEVAYPLVRMSLDAGYTVTALIYPSCKEPLFYMLGNDAAKVQWIIKKPSQSKREFIKEITRQANLLKPARIFINTVADNHIFFAKAIQQLSVYQPIITLHNTRSFFEHKYTANIRRLVRIFGKKQIIRHATEIAILSHSMLPYVESHLPKAKKIYILPGSLYEGVIKDIPSIALTCKIAVPGSIDPRRRNYNDLFSLVRLLESKKIRAEIILLGAPHGTEGMEIISKARQWQGVYCKLVLHCGQIISQQEYDFTIQNCHFLLALQHSHFVADDNIEETYGSTITSGNIFDAIRNATPVLHPAHIPIDKRLQPMCVVYNPIEQLGDIIKEFQQQPINYDDLLQATYNCVQGFTSKAQRAFLKELFPTDAPAHEGR